MRTASLFILVSVALLALTGALLAVVAASSPHKHHHATESSSSSSADELTEFFRLKSAFDAYRARFNREYNEEQHPEEYAARFQHFQDSIKRSEQRNKQHNTNVFGLTKFSDMSRDDFRKTYLTYKPNPGFASDFKNGDITTTLPAHTKVNTKKLPTEVDWRKAGVVTNVNDQGQCGACWAFSATETVESAFLQANPSYLGEVANGWGLSVEEMIDCKNFGLFGGCQGGWADLGYEWVKTNGLMNATDDPYTAGDGTTGACLPLAKPVTYLKSYSFATPPCLLDCSHQKMDVLQQSIATIAPISICLDAGAWDDYTGGIFPASSCNSGFTSMDHCVQLVGYSINATDPTQSYWLVRNSWNTNWGVEGYIHLQFDYNQNTCGMANQATNVQLNATKEWAY